MNPRLLVAALFLAVACASPPAPAPSPSPAPETARAPARVPPPTSARVPDTTSPPRPRVETTDVKPVTPPPRKSATRTKTPRPRARTDTLAPRELVAPVRVCAGGDVTLGTNLDLAWSRTAAERLRSTFGLRDDPAELIAPLRPLVEDADVVLLNVESAIGEGLTPTKCGKRSTHCFAFRSPVSSAAAVRGVAPNRTVVANVANNHSQDAGAEGRDITVALLARAGVLVTGHDTIATAVPTPGGDTIGVLGFYTSVETPDARDTAAVYRHVARAAAQYPIVIATMHLGAEGKDAQRTKDKKEIFLKIDRGNPVAFADAAVRGGATLVVGHGPHVLRAMEWRERGALIAYSLGNLLTYGPFKLEEPMNRGAVLCATIDKTGRVSEASLASTLQRVPGVLVRDTTQRASALVDSLGKLDFRGTGARVLGGDLRPRP